MRKENKHMKKSTTRKIGFIAVLAIVLIFMSSGLAGCSNKVKISTQIKHIYESVDREYKASLNKKTTTKPVSFMRLSDEVNEEEDNEPEIDNLDSYVEIFGEEYRLLSSGERSDIFKTEYESFSNCEQIVLQTIEQVGENSLNSIYELNATNVELSGLGFNIWTATIDVKGIYDEKAVAIIHVESLNSSGIMAEAGYELVKYDIYVSAYFSDSETYGFEVYCKRIPNADFQDEEFVYANFNKLTEDYIGIYKKPSLGMEGEVIGYYFRYGNQNRYFNYMPPYFGIPDPLFETLLNTRLSEIDKAIYEPEDNASIYFKVRNAPQKQLKTGGKNMINIKIERPFVNDDDGGTELPPPEEE
jgi:hypothetical protein